MANAQPIVVDSVHGQLAVGHNGNLVNAGELRDALVRERRHLPDQQRHRGHRAPVRAIARRRRRGRRSSKRISQVRGAFSFVMMTQGSADRRRAIRTGSVRWRIGRLGDAWVICSGNLRARPDRRDLRPRRRARRSRDRQRAGLEVDQAVRAGARSRSASSSTCISRGPTATCSARASTKCGRSSGARLAREAPVDADVIVPIPDSGVCAAIGYAEASGMPMRMGLIRNHYVGRTFIEPQQSIRHFGVRVKLNPVRSILEGRRVVLVDDSIVRGTTSRKIVRMVRSAGAREVHMRISCPPTISPCFYGVDTPRRSELIAATHTLEEIRKYLDADSVAYLSLDGLTRRRPRRQARATARRATRASIRWRFRATRRRTCSWR